ncbi:MAG: glycosyltransferase family 2 protein [Cephaloticoccus sp.]|nr:glycosyltransferase family 2 protein [Cephaloticoccus sp.]MCF7761782.1 glycosyltransferase family 2 protein [Cephaloticoccus sp.]
MSELPKVTIAIPTYNRAPWLAQTLQGLTTQIYPADRLEILIIDNNSPDNTRDIVASFAHAPHPPRHLLETQQGANFARNRALAEAQGEIIVYGDDDILTPPDWLGALVQPFVGDTDRKIGAVAGEVVPVFPDGCPPWVRSFHGPQAFRPDTGSTEDHQVPMSANLAFRRDVLLAQGGWDTNVGRKGGRVFGGEENGPIRRLRRAGYEIWFAPRASVQHQMPAARTTLRYVKRHAFDSACSRVVGRVAMDREEGKSSTGYLLSRLPGNFFKLVWFGLLAGLNTLVLQPGSAKKSLVRCWRSCGYLYQIPRSMFGRI